MTVWVDASGWLTGLPLRLSQVRGQAARVAVRALVVLGVLPGVLGCWRAVHWAGGGRRLGRRLAGSRALVGRVLQ